MAYTAEMKAKLDSIVAQGKVSVASAIEDISKEFELRKDYIVKPDQIRYDINGGLHASIGPEETAFTDYSRGQLLAKIGLPSRYYDMLIKDGLKPLAQHNLDVLTKQYAKDGLMFRTVSGLTKGVLSPSFGRFDASPLFGAFVQQALASGYVPMKGHNTTNRYQITFLLPEIKEVAPGEYLVFTITFTTSDYGCGANVVELGVLRIVCTNLAVGLNLLRRVHIGSRFSGEESFSLLSDTTHALDVKAVSSALKDIVSKSVDMIPTMEQKLIETVNVTDGSYKVNAALDRVRKEYGKEIAESAKTLYETQGLEALPAMPGAWRMSNVLSLLAQSQNEDTRLDLQKEAFSMIGVAA